MATIGASGVVRDLFGYPHASSSIDVVTNYAMSDDWLWEPNLLPIVSTERISVIGTYPCDANGRFSFEVESSAPQLGLRVQALPYVEIRSNAPSVTKTNIPFKIIELRKTGDHDPHVTLPSVFPPFDIFIDPSRHMLWRFWWNRKGRMSYALEHGDRYGYQGNHRDPDAWDRYLEYPSAPDTTWARSHWGFPKIDDERGINIPWGSNEAVVPFVPAEGTLFHVAVEGDFDRKFQLELDPHYAHLLNSHNELWLRGPAQEPVPRFPGRTRVLGEVEMCSWFMGRKISQNSFSPSETNVGRDETAAKLATRFEGKRVWLVGTWCRETAPDRSAYLGSYHAPWNEIHPLYWIVPFVGGFRRFVAAELFAMGEVPSPRGEVAGNLWEPADQQLARLKRGYSAVVRRLAFGNWSAAADFYAKSAVRLSQYGPHLGIADEPTDPANSLDYAVHLNWAAERSRDQVLAEINRRVDVIYRVLTTLGSGVLVFPCMLFTFEAVLITRFCRSLGFEPPSFDLRGHPVLQTALVRLALSEVTRLLEGEWTLLDDSYRQVFERAAAEDTIAASKIAELYAGAATQLVSYGRLEEVSPWGPDYQEHSAYALANAKSNPRALSGNLSAMLSTMWRDLLPHLRRD